MSLPSFTTTYHSTPYPSISPLKPSLSTSNKTILITGGGSGLGPFIAHAFAESGASKIVLFGRTPSTLLTTKSSIEALFPHCTVLPLTVDISSQSQVTSAFSTAGPIHILISNAASLPPLSPISSLSPSDLTSALQTNVLGPLFLIQAFLSQESNPADHKTLINISTAAIHTPPMIPGMAAYSATKAATGKLIEAVASEYPASEVMVLSVHPGMLATDMARKIGEGVEKMGVGELPAMQMDDPQISANFMVWASSPEARFLRGKFVWANWDVDEMMAKREEIVGGSSLTLGLLGL
ncbi:Short-chain dehydrogenase reductase SDR protein [Rutstroemia sp. NJR-2017a BBW]|nr:Short-chain dehydrogenase reductase SDR protein [Rutstroemia sp. NJR-2017a BBW]